MLHRYLQVGREALLWKIEGLSEYDVRRPLTPTGTVEWWPDDRRNVTLHTILVHMIAETHRHAGHADIVRELVDGSRGLRATSANLPDFDDAEWASHRDAIERAARAANGSGE